MRHSRPLNLDLLIVSALVIVIFFIPFLLNILVPPDLELEANKCFYDSSSGNLAVEGTATLRGFWEITYGAYIFFISATDGKNVVYMSKEYDEKIRFDNFAPKGPWYLWIKGFKWESKNLQLTFGYKIYRVAYPGPDIEVRSGAKTISVEANWL